MYPARLCQFRMGTGKEIMEKKRAWQRMLSGRRLDLLNPAPKDVEIEDIAHGLARVSRWNGQTKGEHAFSVAQHSLLVEQIFEREMIEPKPEEQMYALIHDAAEYVIGDIISPFKATMGGSYKDVEVRLQKAIHERFGLEDEPDEKLKKEIKKADNIAAYMEATGLAGFSQAEAEQFFVKPENLEQDEFDLTPMTAQEAQKEFLKRLEEIKASL